MMIHYCFYIILFITITELVLVAFFSHGGGVPSPMPPSQPTPPAVPPRASPIRSRAAVPSRAAPTPLMNNSIGTHTTDVTNTTKNEKETKEQRAAEETQDAKETQPNNDHTRKVAGEVFGIFVVVAAAVGIIVRAATFVGRAATGIQAVAGADPADDNENLELPQQNGDDNENREFPRQQADTFQDDDDVSASSNDGEDDPHVSDNKSNQPNHDENASASSDDGEDDPHVSDNKSNQPNHDENQDDAPASSDNREDNSQVSQNRSKQPNHDENQDDAPASSDNREDNSQVSHNRSKQPNHDENQEGGDDPGDLQDDDGNSAGGPSHDENQEGGNNPGDLQDDDGNLAGGPDGSSSEMSSQAESSSNKSDHALNEPQEQDQAGASSDDESASDSPESEDTPQEHDGEEPEPRLVQELNGWEGALVQRVVHFKLALELACLGEQLAELPAGLGDIPAGADNHNGFEGTPDFVNKILQRRQISPARVKGAYIRAGVEWMTDFIPLHNLAGQLGLQQEEEEAERLYQAFRHNHQFASLGFPDRHENMANRYQVNDGRLVYQTTRGWAPIMPLEVLWDRLCTDAQPNEESVRVVWQEITGNNNNVGNNAHVIYATVGMQNALMILPGILPQNIRIRRR